MRALMLLVTVIAVVSAPATAGARPGEGSRGTADSLSNIRAQIATERDEAEQAAAAIAYRRAVEHYEQVRLLLERERRILEEAAVLQTGAEAARTRSAINANRDEDADVKATVFLLRVALTPSR
jgi:hypothetical protein